MEPTLDICCLILAALIQPLMAQNFVVSSDKLKQNLQQFSRPRSYEDIEERTKVQNFTQSFFQQLEKHPETDLRVHMFSTKDTNSNMVNGSNIIFTLKGRLYGKAEDKVIIVGAHYDTSRNTPGVDDNGSGMTAMLEIARLLRKSTTLSQRDYTVVFVAFDHKHLEQAGSKTFVNDVLTTDILGRNALLHGAIILDCIMNYNSTENSQKMYSFIQLFFPETYNRIEKNKFRGDFQVVVGKSDEAQMLNNLTAHWKFVTLKSKISKLETITLPISGTINPNDIIGQQVKQVPGDHLHFWTSRKYLKAIVVTDTFNFRGYMMECHQKSCDDLDHVTPEMYRLLTCTTQTIFNYVFQTTTGLTPQGQCGTSSAARLSITSTLLVFTGIIHRLTLCDN